MRDYAKVSSRFWTGETGKKLRASGPETQLVSLYLMSSPHANMLGLYYVPRLFISHETGIPLEGVSKGLRRAFEAHFAAYDDGSETVWVFEMARWQALESGRDALDPKDLRVKGIRKEYASLPKSPFLLDFFKRYVDIFHLDQPRDWAVDNSGRTEGPSKALRSQEIEQEIEQEQEQEQEIEQEQEQDNLPHSPSGRARRATHESREKDPPEFALAWQRYPKRLGANPKRRALRAWQARRRAGVPADELLAGVERYAACCLATAKTGTEFVLQAATFFGRDAHYAEPWDIPDASNGAKRKRKPRFPDDAAPQREWEAVCERYGVRIRPGQTIAETKRAVWAAWESA